MTSKSTLNSLLALSLGVLLTSCTTLNNKTQSASTDKNSVTNKSGHGEIFTYDFDPLTPQVAVGINGTFVVKNGCLLLKSPAMSIFMTPILPAKISYWDKEQGIVYIASKAFLINTPIPTTSGMLLDAADKSNFGLDDFVSEADASCLKDSWIRFGTN